ncbi:GNAT family N-acetyltransferase [Burkholderia sp. Bp9140]|uniref:GNAT family N-acetyltransferase n=1 Tax=Burkholderia sp. Bp9140 TaxID=2184572 RepID=UPI000F572933|nr:GNAT family N-acetyltransferase [Burkholderia sp. Bp9140]RQR55742.1 GNAT family N-acetyltransferase [Burkholderia sp. Bp9140]
MGESESEWDACRAIVPDVAAESIRRTWEARDGTPMRVREIAPADFEIERALIGRLSSNSLYMRLMSARRPTEDEMVRWTRIDRRREGAVIVTTEADGREQLVGVARYAMNEGECGVGECAIVIDDAWQRKGLGGRLLMSLVDLAKRSGVTRLFGTTLNENAAMIALARKVGFTLTREPKMGFVMRLSLDL